MILFATLLLGLALCYAAMMGGFAYGFRRVVQEDTSRPLPPGEVPFVSIVVPARNEEDTVADCLEAILQNEYPPDRFEVIVVDDLSEDDTAARVEALQRRYNRAAVPAGPDDGDAPERLRLLRMDEADAPPPGHKREALQHGLNAARGDLLLTTDADCRMGPQWIRAMVARFSPQVAFVSGPVLQRVGHGMFGDLQALEFLGLVAVGAGAIGWGRPNLCNSANVAYRRSVYKEFAAEEQLSASPADDEMLLQHVANQPTQDAAFCARPEAAIVTDPAPTLRAFWRQRRRWAATGTKYPGWPLRLSIGAVYAFYAMLLIGLLALPLMPGLAAPVLGALILKMAAEGSLLVPACRHFECGHLLRYFLPGQLVQIPYVVLVGAAGFFGPGAWKGRRFD